jgi:hypothetical protein
VAAGEDLAATLLDAALDYAVRGLPVLPLEAGGKKPLNHGGLTDASTDPAVIAAWWHRWPDANVGVRTGTEAGVFVLDVDPRHGGLRSLQALERKHGQLPRTAHVLTGSGGQHRWFRLSDRKVRNSAGQLGDGLDVRGDGGYVVVPPSVHESGNPYKWLRGVDQLADPPEWLFGDTDRRRNGGAVAKTVDDIIPPGRRNLELTSLAGVLRRRGLGALEIVALLGAVNAARCRPPLDQHELEQIADSISHYAPDRQLGVPTYTGPARALAEVVDTFQGWLYLPDPGPVYVILAAVVANRREGDPCWVQIVAASARGKTEMLHSLGGLDEIVPAAVLTEASLLSGTSRKETASDASGGLLRQIGGYGIIALKDFGSILSMNRDARAAVLAALRELYDGSWTRHVGTDGGRTLHWEGKLGLIAGCTPAIDRHHAAIAALGERFAFYRLDLDDPKAQGRAALSHLRRERGMRAALRDAVSGFFAGLTLPDEPTELSDADVERLLSLANFVTRARSPVERDTYVSREIELVPDSEAPGRLIRVLGAMLESLRLIGLHDRDAWPLIVKLGLDSMPAQRWKLLEQLLATSWPTSTTGAATAVGLPTTTTRRTLEDLAAHGVLERESGGEGKPDTWAVADWARADYVAATLPEVSEDPIYLSPTRAFDDISGTVIAELAQTASADAAAGLRAGDDDVLRERETRP